MYKIPANTLFLGKNLVFVPECHSTNTLALQLCQAGNADGTVIITNNQTAGRGQRGNSWEADPGQNLTFSMIFKPAFIKPSHQFYINRAVSLGLLDFLIPKLKDQVKIKWPNDMICGSKKIAGMLIENVIQGSSITFSVAGIGLNVNQLTFSSERASSLRLLTGSEHSLTSLLEDLLQKIESRYLLLRQNQYRILADDYHRALLGVGEWRKYIVHGEEKLGMISGVDEAGRLVVRIEEEEKPYGVKEIEFVY